MISEEVYERNDIAENWREAVMNARNKPIEVISCDDYIATIKLSNGIMNSATISATSLVPYEESVDTDVFFNVLTGD